MDKDYPGEILMVKKIFKIFLSLDTWKRAWLYPVCGMLMGLILYLDLQIPLGVAIGVFYIGAVLLSLYSSGARFTIFVAIVSSALTISVFFISPPIEEMWKALFNRAIALSAIWVTALLGLMRKMAEKKRNKAICEREKALEDVKVLRGLLPICASCKKIRNEENYWIQIESYIKEHSEAEFSHGICPDCVKKLYPEFGKEEGTI